MIGPVVGPGIGPGVGPVVLVLLFFFAPLFFSLCTVGVFASEPSNFPNFFAYRPATNRPVANDTRTVLHCAVLDISGQAQTPEEVDRTVASVKEKEKQKEK